MKQDLFDVDDSHVGPELIGDSYASDSEENDAEVVYLPSERPKAGDTEVTVELRRTNDNRLAVLAYSSLESLVACCGELQPWVALPANKVTEVADHSQADVVLWDSGLPVEQRRDKTETEDG